MTENNLDTTLPAPVESVKTDADAIIRKHALWSAGLGLIPVPVLDMAAISGAQYKMLRDLADLYGIEATNERVRSAVSSLLGSSVPFLVSTGAIGAVAKSIPVVGSVLGMALMPSLAYAATVALGRVFVNHFETGGKLLDFDVEALRTHFRQEFEAAKQSAGEAVGAVVGDKADPVSKKEPKPAAAAV